MEGAVSSSGFIADVELQGVISGGGDGAGKPAGGFIQQSFYRIKIA
jgi:hypothetical protein